MLIKTTAFVNHTDFKMLQTQVQPIQQYESMLNTLLCFASMHMYKLIISTSDDSAKPTADI